MRPSLVVGSAAGAAFALGAAGYVAAFMLGWSVLAGHVLAAALSFVGALGALALAGTRSAVAVATPDA